MTYAKFSYKGVEFLVPFEQTMELDLSKASLHDLPITSKYLQALNEEANVLVAKAHLDYYEASK